MQLYIGLFPAVSTAELIYHVYKRLEVWETNCVYGHISFEACIYGHIPFEACIYGYISSEACIYGYISSEACIYGYISSEACVYHPKTDNETLSQCRSFSGLISIRHFLKFRSPRFESCHVFCFLTIEAAHKLLDLNPFPSSLKVFEILHE